MLLRICVPNLNKDNARRFEDVAAAVAGVAAVNTWRGRAEMTLVDEKAIPTLVAALKNAGFDVDDDSLSSEAASDAGRDAEKINERYVHIDGMTCRSCEITIERKFKKVRGVRQVKVNSATGVAKIVCQDGCMPEARELHSAISNDGYVVRGYGSPERSVRVERPSFMKLIGLFALVLLLGSLLSKLGLFKQQFNVAGSMTAAAALVLGLVAGSSSCIAVSGGLLLSSAAKFNQRFGAGSLVGRMRPVFLFVAGRTFSYAIIGGAIGALGKAFTPSPLATGGLMVLAALYMLVMGADMLGLAPAWLKSFMPRMPKSLSHKIMDAEGKEHPAAPLFLGAGTFFLPCGFTQSLQLYALTTGSFLKSGLILGAFALGTAPALLALGWASSSLKGKAGKFFFQFAGALVVLLGLWNIQNGFTVAGYPLAMPKFGFDSRAVAADTEDGDSLPPIVKDEQIIKMAVGGLDAAYDPDTFTVKAGVPVRWEIDGVDVGGCISYLQSRKLGVGIQLRPGPNVVRFTPKQPGTYSFSCSMGMFRGTINVIP